MDYEEHDEEIIEINYDTYPDPPIEPVHIEECDYEDRKYYAMIKYGDNKDDEVEVTSEDRPISSIEIKPDEPLDPRIIQFCNKYKVESKGIVDIHVYSIPHIFYYRFTVGRGGRKCWIIANKEIQTGNVSIPIQTIPEEEVELMEQPDSEEYLTKIAKRRMISLYDSNRQVRPWDELWEVIKTDHQIRPVFWEIREKIPSRLLKNITKNEWNQILIDSIEGKYRCDPKLIFAFRTSLIHPSRLSMNIQNIMKCSGHVLLIGNSKIGKSIISEKISLMTGARREDKVTSAGLIGYASAGGERHPGTVDGFEETVFIDEFDGLATALLPTIMTLMELGIARADQAGSVVITKFYGTFFFMANPISDDSSSVAASVMRLISKLTSNTGALSTRFGLVLMDSNFQIAKRDPTIPLDDKDESKAQSIVSSMLSACQPEIDSVYKHPSTMQYIERDIPIYRDIVTEEKLEQQTDGVKEFWKNRSESAYRHIRGMSLRASILEYITDLYSLAIEENPENRALDREDLIPDILDRADEILHKKIMAYESETMEYMLNVKMTDSQLSLYKLNEIPITYRAIALCVGGYIQRKDSEAYEVEVTDLKEIYEDMVCNVWGKWPKWTTLWKAFTSTGDQTVNKSLAQVGLRLRRNPSPIVIEINGKAAMDAYINFLTEDLIQHSSQQQMIIGEYDTSTLPSDGDEPEDDEEVAV